MSDLKQVVEEFKRSIQVKKLVRQYSEVNFYRQAAVLLFDWMLVGLAVYVSQLTQSLSVYFLSVIVIGTRQHGLLVFMHEASHYRFSHNKKLNDLVGNVFAAWPILLSVEYYRKNHVAHHRHTNTNLDPDWIRKNGTKDWTFPKTGYQLMILFGKLIFLGSFDWLNLAWQISKKDYFKIMYWVALTLTFSVLKIADVFLLYWVVPLMVVLPLMQRLRSIAEHFGVSYKCELQGTRDVVCGKLEGFFLAPHNISYHLVHHLFPSVPFFNLRAFYNELLKIETYSKYGHRNNSYLMGDSSVLKDLLKCKGELQSRSDEAAA